jgi:hypothetical protein
MKSARVLTVFFTIGLFAPNAFANAYFYFHGYSDLEILQIGTGSIFEGIPGQDVDLTGFRLTVDPLLQRPSLLVDQRELATGYGNFTVGTNAGAGLAASDPFRLQAGDRLGIFAAVSGSATGGNGFARAEAAASTKLFAVNDTDYRVYVDTIRNGDTSEDVYADHFLGDDAWAYGSVAPFHNDGFPNPHVYRFEPHTSSEISFSADAEGWARSVPEPGSQLVWAVLVALTIATVGVNKSVALATRLWAIK